MGDRYPTAGISLVVENLCNFGSKVVHLSVFENESCFAIISYMKKITLGLLLVSILTLSYAPSANAQTVNREALLQQIQSLLVLVQSLQEQLALKKGTQVTSSTFSIPKATGTVEEKASELLSFQIAENPWSNRFTNVSVPKNSYQAHYINTKQPNTVVHKTTVPQVAISYAWDDGGSFKIPSEDFGGYGVGNIDISTS
mgnify:CR=1 FL=1